MFGLSFVGSRAKEKSDLDSTVTLIETYPEFTPTICYINLSICRFN